MVWAAERTDVPEEAGRDPPEEPEPEEEVPDAFTALVVFEPPLLAVEVAFEEPFLVVVAFESEPFDVDAAEESELSEESEPAPEVADD